MTLLLKKLSTEDENLYLHRNKQPLACPYAAGGSVTQMVYPDNKLTIGGQQPSPISDNQPRRVTCGTWCALFGFKRSPEGNEATMFRWCGSDTAGTHVMVEK